jgi:hypothetical protein
MAFVLGARGNEWAWQNKRWESVEHFLRVQRAWANWTAALILFPVILMLFFIIIKQAMPKRAPLPPSIEVPSISSTTAESILQTRGLKVIELNFIEKNIGSIDFPIYSPFIVGKLKNNSNKVYSYVEISFNLYDENNVQVGSTFTNLNNLEPAGGFWQFEAPVLEENAKRCKEKNILGIYVFLPYHQDIIFGG